MKLTIQGKTYDIDAKGDTVTVDGVPFTVKIEERGPLATVAVGGKRYKLQLQPGEASTFVVNVEGRLYTVRVEGALRPPAPSAKAPLRQTRPQAAPGAITALMPGRVLSVHVREGQAVEVGELLLILEAMKMENEVRSPQAGVVKRVGVAPGASVEAGQVLVEVE